MVPMKVRCLSKCPSILQAFRVTIPFIPKENDSYATSPTLLVGCPGCLRHESCLDFQGAVHPRFLLIAVTSYCYCPSPAHGPWALIHPSEFHFSKSRRGCVSLLPALLGSILLSPHFLGCPLPCLLLLPGLLARTCPVT
jgi:hypothetical protein